MAAPKLSELAKKLVVEGILAGESNYEIMGRLETLGIPAILTPQAMSYYRSLPQVRAAIAMWERQALQIGLARRSARLAKLQGLAYRLESRLVPRGVLEDLESPDYLDGKEQRTVDRYLKTLSMIQTLIGHAERANNSADADAELAALSRRQMRDVNPWYSAEDAIENADVMELDDPGAYRPDEAVGQLSDAHPVTQ